MSSILIDPPCDPQNRSWQHHLVQSATSSRALYFNRRPPTATRFIFKRDSSPTDFPRHHGNPPRVQAARLARCGRQDYSVRTECQLGPEGVMRADPGQVRPKEAAFYRLLDLINQPNRVSLTHRPVPRISRTSGFGLSGLHRGWLRFLAIRPVLFFSFSFSFSR